jgi:hypothetical protein
MAKGPANRLATLDAAEADAPPEADATGLVSVVVHTRRSVVYQVKTGVQIKDGVEVPVYTNKIGSAGEVIQVPPAEAAYLRTHGFLHDPITGTTAPVPQPPPEPESRPTINGNDGSVMQAG